MRWRIRLRAGRMDRDGAGLVGRPFWMRSIRSLGVFDGAADDVREEELPEDLAVLIAERDLAREGEELRLGRTRFGTGSPKWATRWRTHRKGRSGSGHDGPRAPSGPYRCPGVHFILPEAVNSEQWTVVRKSSRRLPLIPGSGKLATSRNFTLTCNTVVLASSGS